MLKNMFNRVVNIGRPGHTLWHTSWKARCDVCGKFMPFKKRRGDMHKPCVKQYDVYFAEAERYRAEQDEAHYHMLDTLDNFCGHYGCWKEIDGQMEEFCLLHDPSYDDDFDGGMNDEEDDYVSSTQVFGRALSAFGGNSELAREAATMYPGDFM